MVRACVGAAVGTVCGFALGFLTHYGIQSNRIGGGPPVLEFAFNVGAFIGVGAGAIGAVIGGVGDILAFLRKALPPRGVGPEGDFDDHNSR